MQRCQVFIPWTHWKWVFIIPRLCENTEGGVPEQDDERNCFQLYDNRLTLAALVTSLIYPRLGATQKLYIRQISSGLSTQ